MCTDEVEELRDKLDVIIDHVAVKSVIENRAMRATESLLRTVLPRIGRVSGKYHQLKRQVKSMTADIKHVWVAIHKLEDEIDRCRVVEQKNSSLKNANSAMWEYCDDLDTRLEKLERKLAKRGKRAKRRENLL